METTEVRVVRPLKVIALLCVLFAVILIFISVLTPYWLESNVTPAHKTPETFHQGLWCFSVDNGPCNPLVDKIWVIACGVACAVALAAAVGAFIFVLLCLLSKQQSTKVAFYVVALICIFVAMAGLLVALIVFPVMFVINIQDYRIAYNKTQWYFSWSYGISWGAWLFLFGAAVLMLIDKVRNKSVRKEKGFYDTNL